MSNRQSKRCPERPGSSCSWLIDREREVGTCAHCGRSLPFDPTPIVPKVKQ